MKVTIKGQITIPKGIRKKYGIRPGTEVEVADADGQIVVRKGGPRSPVDRVYGVLKGKTRWRGSDEFIEKLRGGA